VKIVPHFGHLTLASFDIPAHPDKNNVTTTMANKMHNHFFITIHLRQKKEEEGQTVFPLNSFSLGAGG